MPTAMKPRLLTVYNEKSYCSSAGTELPPLPENFGECLNKFGISEACPHVRCRHHLYLDIDSLGRIRLNFPHILPENMKEMRETCSIRKAYFTDGLTRNDIGEIMNVDRERIRQIEESGLAKLAKHIKQNEEDEENGE